MSCVLCLHFAPCWLPTLARLPVPPFSSLSTLPTAAAKRRLCGGWAGFGCLLGAQSGAVLIDLDYKFQLDRLRQCLQGRIRQAFPPARLSPQVLEAVVNDSLARLLIATVADSRQVPVQVQGCRDLYRSSWRWRWFGER